MQKLKLTTVIISFLAFLILSETYLSHRKIPADFIWGWKTDLSNFVEKNQLGYRGQPINYNQDDYVVVLLGDSQVPSFGTSAKNMPERKLQTYLSFFLNKPVKVFSLGDLAYGQDQQLLSLTDYFDSYRADAVIAWQELRSDVWNNTFPTDMVFDGARKPTYWLDKEGSLKGPRIKDSPLRIISVLKRRFYDSSLDQYWGRKHLPPMRKLSLEESPNLIPIEDIDWDIRKLDKEIESNLLKHDKSPIAVMLKDNSPRVDYGISLMNRLLYEMKVIANNNNAIFFTFDIIRADDSPPDGHYLFDTGTTKYTEYFSAKNLQLNRIKANDGIDYLMIDLGLRKKYKIKNDWHLNEYGISTAMKKVAIALAEKIKKDGENI